MSSVISQVLVIPGAGLQALGQSFLEGKLEVSTKESVLVAAELSLVSCATLKLESIMCFVYFLLSCFSSVALFES